jgi:alanyl-tRNA synthetase
MKSSSQLREMFLQFFQDHDHRRVASHSLIPPADPTLLFVNAGMVQFKDIFIGNRSVDYCRATSSQKCLRVSGKHNDLENVGRTARHHTFFEMLGNFSFGDYFKRDAIAFAYDFLVNHVGLDPDRCTYTIFGGDAADGLGPDEEARRYWVETAGIAPERVLEFGKKDNFWSMGETGACGPCSEILYDRGPGPWACGEPDCAPGCDCDRFMEIWNLVFMQYERKEPGGPLAPLPAPSIDTGMGLERLAAIIQGKPSNYETDLFMPFIERTVGLLEELNGRVAPYQGGEGGEDDVAYRVIADHARAAAFLVADGVYPDNEGRGYITRLLVRRAVRFGRKLGFDTPFFHHVCDRVVDEMAGAYPELTGRRDVIRRVIAREEEVFMQTFDEGARALEVELTRLQQAGENLVGGEFLFWLHDERGLQPDLAELIASEKGFVIDRDGYARLMAAKRLASAKADGGGGSEGDEFFRELAARVGATQFVGYDADSAEARVEMMIVSGHPAATLATGASGLVVLDRTPCYAESGGQVGDSGTLVWDGGEALIRTTTKAPGGLFLHDVTVAKGRLQTQAEVSVQVDAVKRQGIRAHHSGTHLLHWALHEVLGDHVKQEGSLVKEDLLRFDFRHFSPLTAEEIAQMEGRIASAVLENSVVATRLMGLEAAVASGAKAFFDDKYEDEVRVVAMGDGRSSELCGGTHVTRTGEIGLLKIVKQEAVSSGVRRIYAVCHEAYVAYAQEREARFSDLTRLLKVAPDELENKIRKVLEQNLAQGKELEKLEQQLLAGTAGSDDGQEFFDAGTVKGAVALLGEGEDGRVRTLSDMLRDKIVSGVVMVGAVKEGKLLFVVASTREVPQGLHCGNMVRELAQLAGARGGGKPDFGQAGGGDPQAWGAMVERFKEWVMSGQKAD